VLGFDLRWVHARLGAVAKARFDTHHLEEYAQTSAALEKATSALAQLEGELSRRSETASAHLVNNSVATKNETFSPRGSGYFPDEIEGTGFKWVGGSTAGACMRLPCS
jgi:hypothetical protein